MEAEKLITVTGRGNIHIVPDVTRVEVKIDSIFRTYDTAYQMAEANLKDIGEVMAKLGLPTEFSSTKGEKCIKIRMCHCEKNALVRCLLLLPFV